MQMSRINLIRFDGRELLIYCKTIEIYAGGERREIRFPISFILVARDPQLKAVTFPRAVSRRVCERRTLLSALLTAESSLRDSASSNFIRRPSLALTSRNGCISDFFPQGEGVPRVARVALRSWLGFNQTAVSMFN